MAGGLKKPLKRSHRVGGIVKNVQLFLPKHIGFYFVFFFFASSICALISFCVQDLHNCTQMAFEKVI